MSEINILNDVPQIFSKKDLEPYMQPLYIMENYWRSEQKYLDFKSRMRNLMRGAIRKLETRDYPITFKFYKEDKKHHTLPFRQFLYNIYIWYPFCELDGIRILDESFILQPEDTPHVNEFLYDKVALILEQYGVKGSIINRYMAEVTDFLASISLDFSQIMALHFSEETFQEMYDDPEIRDIMEMQFAPNEQPAEIEAKLADGEHKLVSKLKSMLKNPLGVILRAGTGIKTKQLAEFAISIGMRPSLTGEIITHPIQNSTLIGGLDRPSYMYIDGLGARKPLLANNKEMGPVGYFGKTLNIGARTLTVSEKIVDCGTKFYTNYHIKSQRHLKLMRGKYYYDPEVDDLKMINIKDKSLIGKTLQVRSAVTCCCGENEVCATCVGNAINLNWDIAEGFGTFISEEYAKDVEQSVLSTKHLLTTKSEVIEFNDDFHKYFSLLGEEIKLLEGLNKDKDLAIYINPEDIKKVEEFDPNSTYNTYIESGKFSVVDMKSGEMTEIKIKQDKQIFIRTETSIIMESNGGLIPFKETEEDCTIFEVSIANSELTKPFYDLIALLDRENRTDMEEITIDTMCQRFLDILVDAGIDVSVVAGEMILNRLCRRPDNVRRRPNFSGLFMPEYRFFGLSKVVEENGSPVLGLIFEQLLRQITRLDIEERQDTSYMDPFFQETVSFEPFFRQREQLEHERRGGSY